MADLAKAGWIQVHRTGPYDEDTPFYYATFPGPSDEASIRLGDPRFDVTTTQDHVIRASHCRTITVMVTDRLLVPPTIEAGRVNVACPGCGVPLLKEGERGQSRLAPEGCLSCATSVPLSLLRDLLAFRFAVVIEPWFPSDHPGVVDPALLVLLGRHAGRAVDEAVERIS